MSGFVVWFTGLSGSGKSTLAAMLSAELRHRGVHVEVLDGDEVRTHLSKGLSFSREDRDTNVRRIGFVAKLIARSGACAMTAAISPYRAIRDEQREQIDRFVEVYCQCAVPVLADRDPKGLYKKALAGEIRNFTGVDDPYEAPLSPEVLVNTGVETKEESLARILKALEELGYLAGTTSPEGPSDGSRRGPIAPHGGELVNRFASGTEGEALLAKARDLPWIQLDERAESDLSLLATGAFSPLRGFMGSKDYLRVVREMRLENGLPWPLPVTLAVPSDAQHSPAALALGAHAALRSRDGRTLGLLEVSDVWTPDKELEAREVYGTTDRAHPGVAALMAKGSIYVGGEVRVLEGPPGSDRLAGDPRVTRATIFKRQWSRVAGVCPATERHAGAREALLGALLLKNHGCSDAIIGSEHSGGSTALTSRFAAFGQGELGIEPVFLEEVPSSEGLRAADMASPAGPAIVLGSVRP